MRPPPKAGLDGAWESPFLPAVIFKKIVYIFPGVRTNDSLLSSIAHFPSASSHPAHPPLGQRSTAQRCPSPATCRSRRELAAAAAAAATAAVGSSSRPPTPLQGRPRPQLRVSSTSATCAPRAARRSLLAPRSLPAPRPRPRSPSRPCSPHSLLAALSPCSPHSGHAPRYCPARPCSPFSPLSPLIVRPTAARHAPAAAVSRPQPTPLPASCSCLPDCPSHASDQPPARPSARPFVRPPVRPARPRCCCHPPPPPPTRFLDSSLPPSLASLAIAPVPQPGPARPVLRPRQLARLAGHPHATALQSVDLSTAQPSRPYQPWPPPTSPPPPPRHRQHRQQQIGTPVPPPRKVSLN